MGKVVVAGGSGLIGRELVRGLVEDGVEVVVLTRRPADVAVPGARSVGWDGRRVERAWAGELEGAAGVVNLAGASVGGGRWTRRRRETIRASRIDATTALVDAIGSLEPGRRPPVLVNASGIDYAGDTGDAPVTEDAGPGDSFLARVCADWEAAAEAATAHGIRVVCMRTSFVIAGDALAFRLLALPFRLFVGGPLGSGRQWFPWVHNEDAARLYRHGLENEALAGPVNVVAPDLRRQRELAVELGRALRRPAQLPAPAPLLRAVLGRQAELLLHGQRARSLRLDGFAFRYPELPAALAEALA
jgi:uncharacterized protein (TIGR01777 family)